MRYFLAILACVALDQGVKLWTVANLELYENAQGYYNNMLDVLDLAFMTVNHEKIPPSVLKQWVGMITDEISQISKIKRSDKGR